MNSSDDRNITLGQMLTAIGLALVVMVIAASIALNAISDYQSGVTDRPPLAQMVIGLLVVIVCFGVIGFVVYDRHGVVANRNSESAATVGRIKSEASAIQTNAQANAKAVVFSARVEYQRLQMQVAAVTDAGRIAQLPPPSIDETKLLSRPYTIGNRMVTIPLNRLKQLIEIAPNTSRAAIKAAGITNSDQECSDLVAAAELEGWVIREGQGKPSVWDISPLQARRAYMLLVEDALNRARDKTPSFDAPTAQNALLFQSKPVYETGRQTGRQA